MYGVTWDPLPNCCCYLFLFFLGHDSQHLGLAAMGRLFLSGRGAACIQPYPIHTDDCHSRVSKSICGGSRVLCGHLHAPRMKGRIKIIICLYSFIQWMDFIIPLDCHVNTSNHDVTQPGSVFIALLICCDCSLFCIDVSWQCAGSQNTAGGL